MVLLIVTDLLLAIPSKRHHLYPLQDTLNWPWIMVSFWSFHPPGIVFLSFTSSSQHSQNHIVCCQPPADYSITEESFLSPPWRIQQGQDDVVWRWLPSSPRYSSLYLTWTMRFPPSSRQLLFPLPSFITGSWTWDCYPFLWNLDSTSVSGQSSYPRGVCYQQRLPCLVCISWSSWTYCYIFSQHTFNEKQTSSILKETKKQVWNKQNYFRPHLDMSRGVFGLPGTNKNESLHKTDCCNVLSNLW